MEKIIRLSEKKLMIFYQLPIVLVESHTWLSINSDEKKVIGIGIQKTRLRYKIELDRLNHYEPKPRFWKILKSKYEKKFPFSNYSLEYEKSSLINFEGVEYKIELPTRIVIKTSKEIIDEYIVDNRFDQIDSLL